MIISRLILFLLMVMLTGCTTAHKMNNISLGMTKQEVIKNLGRPSSASAQSGVEYLNYNFVETDADYWRSDYTPYYVRIVNGKVESYGKLGDFDSTKTPETKTTVDLNINPDSK